MGSCGEEELDLLFLPFRISVRTGLHLEPILPSNPPSVHLSTKPPTFPSCPSSPGKPLSRTYPNLQPTSQKLPFFLYSCVHPCKYRLLPGPRGSRHPPLSSKKGCSPGIHPDVICAQLYRFTPRRSPPGPVPRRTQGLQGSAKGTASCVFTGPSISTLTQVRPDST